MTIFLRVIFFIYITSTTMADLNLPYEMCSELYKRPNVCVLRQLHYTMIDFEFNLHFGMNVIKMHILNSTIPKLGNFGICKALRSSDDDTNHFLQIEEIYMVEVGLTEFSIETFAGCENLEVLQLQHNRIQKFGRWLKKNHNLVVIDLSYNLIDSIEEDAFESMKKLQELFLSGNYLKHFSAKLIIGCESLEVLQLDSNDLLDLNEKKIVENIPKLRRITLTNNQFRCERVKNILDAFRPGIINFKYEGELRKRIITPTEVVNSIHCLPEIPWAAAHYIFTYRSVMNNN